MAGTGPSHAWGRFGSLLAAAVGGDEQAFARLWRDLPPGVLRCLRVAPDAADDVASETWLEVVRGPGQLTGDETGFRSWAFTIARTVPWTIAGAVRAG